MTATRINSVSLPAVSVDRISGRIAGAPAAAAGAAGSDVDRDVEQLGSRSTRRRRRSWASGRAISSRSTSQQGSMRVPAFPSPGIAPDVIAMPVGQGHENFTRYASGRGENPIAILAPVDGTGDGRAGVGGDAREDRAVGEADGSLILFAGALRDYPPEQTASLDHKGHKGTKNGTSMGNGGRSRPLHGLRSLRDGVPRRKQHPDRRAGTGGARPRACTGSASSATAKAISRTCA